LITMATFLNTSLYLLLTISPILMRTNTNKFNSLKYPTLCVSWIPGVIVYYHHIENFVASWSLVLFYPVAASLGIIAFMRKYDYVKSLSLSVALAYAASGIWEIPIILYTIAYKGYVDGAFPLHMLPIIPLLLLVSDIRIQVSYMNVAVVLIMMLFNCAILGVRIVFFGANIWCIYSFISNIPFWLSRVATIIALYSIYYGGELKR